MRITVLRRGGLSVYGGSYDPKRNIALADTDQQQTVTINYPDAITAVSASSDGLTLGTRSVSGSKVTFTISGNGSADLIATMGDERPAVRIETPRASTQDYCG